MNDFNSILLQKEPHSNRDIIAAKVFGELYDLSCSIPTETTEKDIQFLRFSDKEGEKIFWHSSAHILAHALVNLYENVQLDDGPAISQGAGLFYYDFACDRQLSEEDFPTIEKEIQKIAQQKLSLERFIISREQAIQKFQDINQPYKIEIIKKIPNKAPISIYKQGNFVDLCRGPHVPNTSLLKNVKLTAISGIYYKNDPSEKMLQRIYGVSFPTKKETKMYFNKIEELKKRDHRKIGKELELFSFQKEGQGFPFFHPKGVTIWNTLLNYIKRKCDKQGYLEIKTPILLQDTLWHNSGHYANFKDNMYFTKIDKQEYVVKPMNCPGANLVYRSSGRSYKNLPVKLLEFGLVHRHELSGALSGLFRVRSFTQDDAHIYCTKQQLEIEVKRIIGFTLAVYNDFMFHDTVLYVATKPKSYMGTEENWNYSTTILKKSIEDINLKYGIKEGEGAFYGPKIEFNIRDCMNRLWQCGTIQIDFSMPEKFDLKYKDNDGKFYRPIMIHHAVFGSLERFLGILIEHYSGCFPLWIAPEQVRILSVNQEMHDYANKVLEYFQENNILVKNDISENTISYKIRKFIKDKVNYAIILGNNEHQNSTISVRKRGNTETKVYKNEEFLKIIKKEIRQKSN